jgi:hypothetical protein
MFASSQIPMLVKVFKTRNLQSYSLSNLVISNLGNLIHWVYIVTVPGPLWYLHGFFTVTTAVMLLLYLRYEIGAEKFKAENRPFTFRKLTLPIGKAWPFSFPRAGNTGSLPLSFRPSTKPVLSLSKGTD